MITLQIQPFDFDLHCTNDRQEAIDWLKEKYSHCDTIEEEIEAIKNCRGLFIDFASLLFWEIEDESVLDHEILHVTWYFLNKASIPISTEEHEIQCYLFEHIKRLILNSSI